MERLSVRWSSDPLDRGKDDAGVLSGGLDGRRGGLFGAGADCLDEDCLNFWLKGMLSELEEICFPLLISIPVLRRSGFQCGNCFQHFDCSCPIILQNVHRGRWPACCTDDDSVLFSERPHLILEAVIPLAILLWQIFNAISVITILVEGLRAARSVPQSATLSLTFPMIHLGAHRSVEDTLL